MSDSCFIICKVFNELNLMLQGQSKKNTWLHPHLAFISTKLLIQLNAFLSTEKKKKKHSVILSHFYRFGELQKSYLFLIIQTSP